jgi:cell division protein FtsL
MEGFMTGPKNDKAAKRAGRISIKRVLVLFAMVIGLLFIFVIVLRVDTSNKRKRSNAASDIRTGKVILGHQSFVRVDLQGRQLNLLKRLSTDATLTPFQRKAIEVEIIELDEKIAETEKKIEETKRKIADAEKILK